MLPAASESACIVITGASRGIGKATAHAFAARGFPLALLSRNETELAATAALLTSAGANVRSYTCDVASADSVQYACTQLAGEFAEIRAVINNAGAITRAAVHEMSEADWDLNININLKGPFLVTRALLPRMLQSGSGRIVNVSSISATLGSPRASAYCAAKWGLVGFTKSLAEELRGTGLQALAVLPGSVDTAMLAGSGFTPQMQPEHVAGTIVFAALDAPAAMNASAIEVFGP
jgi:NAD(P)-dependent dehydrogenase (short-subunit alcohol dehydrogenase family)